MAGASGVSANLPERNSDTAAGKGGKTCQEVFLLYFLTFYYTLREALVTDEIQTESVSYGVFS